MTYNNYYPTEDGHDCLKKVLTKKIGVIFTALTMSLFSVLNSFLKGDMVRAPSPKTPFLETKKPNHISQFPPILALKQKG